LFDTGRLRSVLKLVICLGVTTNSEARALTVAGQWRNFTAFPSILAIALVK
jgi:hypothetical protein